MLICPDFIILNSPKTGSSFVREVVKTIFDNRYKKFLYRRMIKFGLKEHYQELMFPHFMMGYPDQHGGYYQIPSKFINRKIVSVVRNPYHKFLSEYRFRWWEKHPEINTDLIRKHLPLFPNLTIDEFIEYRKILAKEILRKYGNENDIRIGVQSLQFIKMFFREPFEVIKILEEKHFDDEIFFKQYLADINFLEQKKLNKQLYSFLIKNNISKNESNFILGYDRVNISPNKNKAILTKNIIDYVNRNERFLFNVLRYKGFCYNFP